MNVRDQPGAVRFERITDRLDNRRGIGHIVQAIKAGNEIKAVIRGNGVPVRVVKGDVLHAGLGLVLFGPGQGVFRDIVAVTLGLRKGFGDLEQRHAGSTADIGHSCPGLKFGNDPVQGGQRLGDQVGLEPRGQKTLNAARALGSEGIIGETQAGLERLRESFHHPHLLRQRTEPAGQERRAVFVG